MNEPGTIVMIGATGAVGTEVVRELLAGDSLIHLCLLGRRTLPEIDDARVIQHEVDLLNPASYQSLPGGYKTAICTLGVGQPSKVSREEFTRIDKQLVLDFATACRSAGVTNFSLLASVGADADSRSFYLRTKGELQDGLRALAFDRLSLFQPSMILTEENRYGFSQAITLALWPLISPLMVGPLRAFRGIEVGRLGTAIARDALLAEPGTREIRWNDIVALS